MQSTTAFRVPSGFINFSLDSRKRRYLATSAPIVDEIFSTLEFHSEIDEIGLKFFQAKAGCSEDESKIIYPKFQAFVRQAKTFFVPAETLHHRARPLFYYYAFLNLGKALLCVKNPQLFLSSDKFSHGIFESHIGNEFTKEGVIISHQGIFVEIYKALTGLKFPNNSSLNIVEMLRYSTDISYDYESQTASDLNIARGKCRLCLDAESKNKWLVMGMLGFSELEAKNAAALNLFHSLFEEVKIGPEISERLFGLMNTELPSWRFFQTRKSFPNSEDGHKLFSSELKPAFSRYFEASIYEEPIEFHLSLPLGNGFEFPWSEFLAGYTVYFYLGSLVRYHPAYLEKLLRTKHSWRLEAFTKSASNTLLRQALSLILGELYIFKCR